MATSIIDNQDLLYPTFLEDHRIYHLVEAYWHRRLDHLLSDAGLTFHTFYNKKLGNGKYLYDANPIFDAYFPACHKLVRIIQYYPEPDDPLFYAYLDHWPVAEMDPDKRPLPEDDSKALEPIPELVIDLALTKNTAASALELIRQWVVENLTEEEMVKVIGERE